MYIDGGTAEEDGGRGAAEGDSQVSKEYQPAAQSVNEPNKSGASSSFTPLNTSNRQDKSTLHPLCS